MGENGGAVREEAGVCWEACAAIQGRDGSRHDQEVGSEGGDSG